VLTGEAGLVQPVRKAQQDQLARLDRRVLRARPVLLDLQAPQVLRERLVSKARRDLPALQDLLVPLGEQDLQGQQARRVPLGPQGQSAQVPLQLFFQVPAPPLY